MLLLLVSALNGGVRTLTVPLSTQKYKWVPAMLGIALRWSNIPSRGGVEIFLVAACYRNRDKLRHRLTGHLARMQTLPHLID